MPFAVSATTLRPFRGSHHSFHQTPGPVALCRALEWHLPRHLRYAACMAREESDREDLLREATALVERVEFQTTNGGEPIVVGFRSNGALSVFFGGDTAYHFTSDRQLRRAYVAGLLYKADRGRLASLERIRQDDEVQLVRRDLSDESQAAFLTKMQETLGELAARIECEELRVVGQVPAEANVRVRVQAWLRDAGPILVAQRPHAT